MDVIDILKIIFFNSSLIFLSIAITFFLLNIIGLVERFRKWSLILAENAIKHGRPGEGTLSVILLVIYRFRDAIIISIFLIGIVSTFIFSYLDIFFSEPYVTYELLMTAIFSLVALIFLLFTNLRGEMREANKELRDIREAIGEIRGWTKGYFNGKK